MTILIETVGNHTIFSKPATLKQILKNPFTYKDKVRRERVKAIIAAQQASPTLDFGGVTIINPVYRGPNPYQGPELSDPRNKANMFIPVHKENTTKPHIQHPSPPYL